MLVFNTPRHPEDLISRIAKGDIAGRRAANQLYDIFRYMIRVGQQKFHLPENDALSAYNQALTSLILAIQTGSFRGDSSLKTYLHRAFFNQCINLSKQLRRTAETNTELGELDCADEGPDCVRQMIAREKLECVFKCMDKLSSKARAILWGAAYDGLSSKEIAERNGLKNAATVDVLKRRYRKQLKQMVKEAA